MLAAIRQGRSIYANIHSAIRYLLATNVSEILVMFGGVAGGLGQPLTPLQLLWINLVSDIFPVITLATQPPEPDIMLKPPRDPNESFLDRRDLADVGAASALISAGSLGAYLWAIRRYGRGQQAGAIAFTSLATGQLLHMLSAHSRSLSLFHRDGRNLSPSMLLALASGLAMQAMLIAVPPLRRLLGLSPLSLPDVAACTLGASLPLLANEGIKAARCRESRLLEAPQPACHAPQRETRIDAQSEFDSSTPVPGLAAV
jgi:Ca2+-transporting ATPase